VIESVLAGRSGAPRTAVVMNSAAALLAADAVETWEQAARMAEASIDSGKAADALERLRRATNA
jgi:anthranilate phosphoribosyltransferase